MSRNVLEIKASTLALGKKYFQLKVAQTLECFWRIQRLRDDVTLAISRSTTKTTLLDADTQTRTERAREGERRAVSNTVVAECRWHWWPGGRRHHWLTRFTWPMNERNRRQSSRRRRGSRTLRRRSPARLLRDDITTYIYLNVLHADMLLLPIFAPADCSLYLLHR